MRMLQRSAGGFSVILEEQNILEAAVFFEIENTIAEGPEHVFNSFRRKRRESRGVFRGFDDDFVSADAVHLVEHAFGLLVQIALDAERRKFIGNDTDGPARS